MRDHHDVGWYALMKGMEWWWVWGRCRVLFWLAARTPYGQSRARWLRVIHHHLSLPSINRSSLYFAQRPTVGDAKIRTLTVYLTPGLHFPVSEYRGCRIMSEIIIPFQFFRIVRLESIWNCGAKFVNRLTWCTARRCISTYSLSLSWNCVL